MGLGETAGSGQIGATIDDSVVTGILERDMQKLGFRKRLIPTEFENIVTLGDYKSGESFLGDPRIGDLVRDEKGNEAYVESMTKSPEGAAELSYFKELDSNLDKVPDEQSVRVSRTEYETEAEWILPHSEDNKARARGGYKPGQIVHLMMKEMKAVDFDDLVGVPYRALKSRRDADPSSELFPGIKLSLPLISANMESVTGDRMALEMARMGGFGVLHQFMPLEEQIEMVQKVRNADPSEKAVLDGNEYEPCLDAEGKFVVSAARGIKDYRIEHARELYKAGLKILTFDVAQGHSEDILKAVYQTKQEIPDLYVISGNVATMKATIEHVQAGADAVKVGIAQSMACATEKNTGAGIPQPHAVYLCALAAHDYGKKIIGDGGFSTGGRIVTGLAFGADAIMVGTALAATDEANLFEERKDTDGGVLYYGSASERSKTKQGRPVFDASEGNDVILDYEGGTREKLSRLKTWINSGMSYAGRSEKENRVDLERLQNQSRWMLRNS